MKIKKLKIRDIGPRWSTGEIVEVDFDQLGAAKLIAIKGRNGAGKTSLIECIPGAVYRQLPSRGSVADQATGKESLIELDLDAGKSYRCQVQIDGTSKTKKQSAYLDQAEAQGPLNDGKVTTYDEQIAKYFPPRQLYLSSAFAAQGGQESFLNLDKAERKQLFARMLGLGRMQIMSDKAGEKARAVSGAISQAEATRGVYAQAAEKMGRIAVDIDIKKEQLMQANEDLDLAQVSAEQSAEVLRMWEESRQNLELDLVEKRAQAKTADSEWAATAKERTRIRSRIEDVASEHERAVALLEDRAHYEEQALTISIKEAWLAEVETRLAECVKAALDYRERRQAWELAVKDAESDIKRLESEHKQEQQRFRDEVAQLSRDFGKAEAAKAELEEVPCFGESKFRGCPLISTAAQLSASHAELGKKHAEAMNRLVDIQSEPVAVAVAKARLASLRDNVPSQDAVIALGMISDHERHLQRAREELDAAKLCTAKLEAMGDAQERAVKLCHELEKLRLELATASDQVEKSEARYFVAGSEVGAADTALKDIELKRPQAVDESDLSRLQTQVTDLTAAVAVLERQLADAAKAKERAEAQNLHIINLKSNMDDWKALQRAYGKDGIQALEIDAAGPEVSGICNDLLHACYGGRFTVALETTALKADGKATKEVFDLSVIDTELGTEGSASDKSGGERVIISEALSLAIAIFNTRKSEIPMLDLFRDECSGALSQDHAPLYLGMLRKAIELGGFHRCFFIAHQPELWELADRTITIENGKVVM